ncbi:PAS domain-containing sensor histidine kinase [Clostridium algoriphilum]|uniref:PAS domain-containing sensor histidine kinase n=1 Tax=Clostridium algoriphilum TaxID=198347 RepID=UPI001CF5A9BB|nr:PAS domain-containing sensor histidine kinase [Clostridium algoriphilum]MCB2294696.1 PAS domain-containing sensor histidine kinase [Clostridium algoriphilum]
MLRDTLNNRMAEPFMYSYGKIITEVNKEFTELTGFLIDEIVGKSLHEVGDMLKINSQTFLENITCKYSGYIFTKRLCPREVNISLLNDNKTNEKKYTFIEKLESRLDDKLIFEKQAFIDETSGVAVYSVPDLILLKANAKYLSLMKGDLNRESSSIGRPIREVVSEFKGSQSEVSWNSILKSQRTSYIKEFKNNKLDANSSYWGFAQTTIFERGKMKYIYETASEVTERVFKNQSLEWQNKIIDKQKSQLEQRNNQLSSILENLSDGIMITDNLGKIIMTNPETRRLICKSSKEIMVKEALKNIKLFDMKGNKIPVENIPSVRALRGERVKSAKVLVSHPKNDYFVEISSIPSYNTSGDLTMVVSCFHDITETIKQSRKIEEHNILMEKELKSQDEFLVNISHELKTPLNVIFATVQLFTMYCDNGCLDDKKNSIIKYIDSIKQNSYRLSKLINNIVDISKIQAGFFKLTLSNNNIVEVVEEIVMSVTNFTESKGLSIIFDTDIEEKNIACDPEKIERIVLNLISNAIKFSDIGDEIFVAIKDKGEFVELSVKDNGIGIEKKHLDMIFDRFKQVDKSLSRNAEGTGIGLNLVKSIVALHGGNIFVESEVGKGSKFTVRLPAIKVINENMMYNSKVRSGDESIRVELSDIYS